MSKGGQISRIVVGQLHSELSDVKNRINHEIMDPELNIGVALKHLGVLADFRAAFEFTTGNNVLKVKILPCLLHLRPYPKWMLVLSFFYAHLWSLMMLGMKNS